MPDSAAKKRRLCPTVSAEPRRPTLDLTDTDPRTNYVTGDKTAWYMRKASARGLEILPLSSLSNGNARRWVREGARSCSRATTRTIRTYTYDTNSGELEQLTFHPQRVVGGMMWRPPEFKNE